MMMRGVVLRQIVCGIEVWDSGAVWCEGDLEYLK